MSVKLSFEIDRLILQIVRTDEMTSNFPGCFKLVGRGFEGSKPRIRHN